MTGGDGDVPERSADRVVIPVKGIASGKSRLSAILDDTERQTFNRRMLIRTLKVVTSACAERPVVVSPDDEALGIAADHGAEAVRQSGLGLNDALAEATRRLKAGRTTVIPADLPFLSAGDIATLLRPGSVVIAPDRRTEGTNALSLPRPGIIGFRFGPASFARHVRAARDAGVPFAVVERAGLACDIDTPDDYREFEASLADFC